MKFLTSAVTGFAFALSLGWYCPEDHRSLTWTDEQKYQALCGGFAGIVGGLLVLVIVTLFPIIWIFT